MVETKSRANRELDRTDSHVDETSDDNKSTRGILNLFNDVADDTQPLHFGSYNR